MNDEREEMDILIAAERFFFPRLIFYFLSFCKKEDCL